MSIEIHTLVSDPSKPVTALDLTPEGDKLVLAHPGLRGAPGVLALWHARREELIFESPSPSHSGLFGARFARAGKTVVYGALDSRGIYEFELLNQSRRKLDVDVQNPRWLSIGAGSKYLCVAGDTTRVYDLARREFVLTEALPDRPSPDGKPAGLACVSDDGARLVYQMNAPAQLVLFNAQTLRVLRRLTGGPAEVQALAIDPTGQYAGVIEFETRGTFLWRLETGLPHLPELFNAHMTHNWSMRFSPDGKRLALGMTTGFVYAVNLETGHIEFERKLHEGRVWDLCFARDGSELYTAGEDGQVCRINLRAGESTAFGLDRPGFE
jgi:WD40 repeat protein